MQRIREVTTTDLTLGRDSVILTQNHPFQAQPTDHDLQQSPPVADRAHGPAPFPPVEAKIPTVVPFSRARHPSAFQISSLRTERHANRNSDSFTQLIK
ncbi:hypothetical protein GWI33_011935 [Rhynchophorus ferrugineus]|uniref:Uncharacterized protein n=1 Tax=Rhynchophorus ferrugineus TaxID=354439 RepID=A0A834IPS8_RHYFE|nr:hypothetical protein GWI33_011935 [Rhynchophorus ferrugineus]